MGMDAAGRRPRRTAAWGDLMMGGSDAGGPPGMPGNVGSRTQKVNRPAGMPVQRASTILRTAPEAPAVSR
jgi:hypothetical protein